MIDIIRDIAKDKIYYQDEDVIVYCGDCLEIMPLFPDKSFDMVLTDPPFMISRECKITRSMNPQKYYKYRGKDINLHFGDWDCQWKNEDEYLEWSNKRLKECFKILKEGGHFVSFYDRLKIPYLVKYGRENGMIMRQFLFWKKLNPVPRARCVNFMEAIEMATWLTKGTTSRKKATFNYQLGQHPNVFDHCIVGHTTRKDGERIHPTQKPVAFGEWVILYLTKEGNIVLDPFLGSGTTLVAAKKLSRKAVGIELSEKYCKSAVERIKSMTLPLLLNL